MLRIGRGGRRGARGGVALKGREGRTPSGGRWRRYCLRSFTTTVRLFLSLLPCLSTIADSLASLAVPNSYYQHLNNLETTDELVAREREEARVQATATGALLPGPLSRFIERVNEWMQEIGGDAQRMKEEVLAVGGKV